MIDIENISFREINDQLQILEYIAANTRQGLTDDDRQFHRQLEKQKHRLLRSNGGAA
jgi:hypothetical protein